ncbi:MAG: hypothetical protein AAGJ18_11400, partial [Bacteroidota bacterium]
IPSGNLSPLKRGRFPEGISLSSYCFENLSIRKIFDGLTPIAIGGWFDGFYVTLTIKPSNRFQ